MNNKEIYCRTTTKERKKKYGVSQCNRHKSTQKLQMTMPAAKARRFFWFSALNYITTQELALWLFILKQSPQFVVVRKNCLCQLWIEWKSDYGYQRNNLTQVYVSEKSTKLLSVWVQEPNCPLHMKRFTFKWDLP